MFCKMYNLSWDAIDNIICDLNSESNGKDVQQKSMK